MKNLLLLKINSKNIQKKAKLVQKEIRSVNRIEKSKKYFYYFLGITLPSMYVWYMLKASGLMKKLEIDKKISNKKKQIEESHGVDLKLNDELIKEYENKMGINKAKEKYEEKLKFGNKELNEKKDEDNEQEILEKIEEKEIIREDNNSNPLQVESTVNFDSRLDEISKKHKF